MKTRTFLFALAATMMLFVSCDKEQNIDTEDPDWVDLGLPSGLLWATCNVGATTPEEYGDYFAWGETQPKSVYNWDTYKYCNGAFDQLTKYCYYAPYGYNDFTDYLTILEPDDDAATAILANGARTPTEQEWEELQNNTSIEWTTLNGVNGCRFTATNGKSIFLPAAGLSDSYNGTEIILAETYGSYWSSSLSWIVAGCPINPGNAWHFTFSSDEMYIAANGRCMGRTIRAVKSSAKSK